LLQDTFTFLENIISTKSIYHRSFHHDIVQGDIVYNGQLSENSLSLQYMGQMTVEFEMFCKKVKGQTLRVPRFQLNIPNRVLGILSKNFL